MQPAANDLPPQQVSDTSASWPGRPEIETHQRRNLLLLAVHQVVFRVGWVFKTESVIMPAFLDAVAGAGWMRGFLPVLNRFGQSLPPVFCAGHLGAMRQKKRALLACIVLMSLPFGTLALTWQAVEGQRRAWMPWLFLVLYGVFFLFNGLYHLSFGTVQGKLIRPTRRGHLLLVSTFWGSIPAMFFAWWLLRKWLDLPDRGFGYIFAFTASCFFLSALTIVFLFEPADHTPAQKPIRFLGNLKETSTALQHDGNLRRLVFVAMLFGSGLIIFPHYQALARIELGLTGTHLVIWVIVQSTAVGAYSLFVGPLADAWGNRLTLRVLIFASAIAPLFAIFLSSAGGLGVRWFWLVFIPLGVTPLVLRILVNYALEICEPADHPRYLSTVSLCLAVPFVFAPAVGYLVDVTGFQVVFLATTGLLLLSGLMTFSLDEPRHRIRAEKVDAAAGTIGEE